MITLKCHNKKTETSQKQSQSFNNQTNFQFDPTSMAAYQQLLGQGQGALGQYMSDPFSSTFFNQKLGMMSKQIGNMFQGQQNQLYGNLAASGMSGQGSSGFFADQLAKLSRAQSGAQASGFGNLLMDAEGARRWATGMGLSFQPLQTGVNSSGTSNMQGSSVTKEGGLGSWLPQLIGGLGGAALGAFTGGASSAMGAGGGMAKAGVGIGSAGMGMGSFSSGANNLFGGGGGMAGMTGPGLFNPFNPFH